MQVGNLVKITRASIGVPIGSIGMVLNLAQIFDTVPPPTYKRSMPIWHVQIFGNSKIQSRRFCVADLEIINA